VDEIIVSTFPGEKTSSWLRGDLINRLRKQTGLPSSTSRSTARRRGLMATVDHAAHPPVANQSSRVDARTLGMFLFIASEIMLFGSFFTAYFFVRVAAGTPWPTPPYELPVFVAGMNTIILVTSSFTMHWALQSIKRAIAPGCRAGSC
jgi:heme/copper-type cytochrome/quinol oxidase subunit 3